MSGNGKGGTCFVAAGSGKVLQCFFYSFIMRDVDLGSPTIILITDRVELDDQLSRQFSHAKNYVGDENIIAQT